MMVKKAKHAPRVPDRIRELLENIDSPSSTDDPVLETLRELLRELEEGRSRPRRVIVSLESTLHYEMPLLTDPPIDHATSDVPGARLLAV